MSFQAIVDSLVPNFIKHFSAGSTLGICLGITISFFVSGNLLHIILALYILLTIIGLYKTKDDWKEQFS